MAEADAVLDLRGLACPMPVLRTKRALAALPAGAEIVVEATDPMASLDIPHFCNENGHRLLSRETDGRVVRFRIARGG